MVWKTQLKFVRLPSDEEASPHPLLLSQLGLLHEVGDHGMPDKE